MKQNTRGQARDRGNLHDDKPTLRGTTAFGRITRFFLALLWVGVAMGSFRLSESLLIEFGGESLRRGNVLDLLGINMDGYIFFGALLLSTTFLVWTMLLHREISRCCTEYPIKPGGALLRLLAP